MQPAPHQQQQQQPETQAGGGGQVSSTDVQAILQQLQRSQNGSQLPMAPLSQATSERCSEGASLHAGLQSSTAMLCGVKEGHVDAPCGRRHQFAGESAASQHVVQALSLLGAAAKGPGCSFSLSSLSACCRWAACASWGHGCLRLPHVAHPATNRPSSAA